MNKRARVKELIWHSPGIFELQLERNGSDFVPGDCLAIYTEDGRTSRPYSFASGLDEEVFRFIIRKMEEGAVTPYLATCKPGDEVEISEPFGWFRPGAHHDEAPFVFLATGTGIAPFLSYLRTYPDAPPLQCLYGVRTLGDAVGWDWVKDVCSLKLALSREKIAEHHHGHCTDLLDQSSLDPAYHYYLCGLDAMIDEASDWLEQHGVDVTHIHRECFFNAAYST